MHGWIHKAGGRGHQSGGPTVPHSLHTLRSAGGKNEQNVNKLPIQATDSVHHSV